MCLTEGHVSPDDRQMGREQMSEARSTKAKKNEESVRVSIVTPDERDRNVIIEADDPKNILIFVALFV